MLTHMRREIDEIPEAAARLIDGSADALAAAGDALAAKDPAVIVTVARGSSDHAALFLKYAIELSTGLPVASLGPSLASVYGARLKLDRAGAFAISQSGKSPDIVALTAAATAGGATSIALTNTLPSPIADASRYAVDTAAGPEICVAATKSFVNSVIAGLAVIARWTGNAALSNAVAALPEHLARAVKLDWSPLMTDLRDTDKLYVLGRGPALAIADEAALKFQELAGTLAESYSAAEVMHGPVALVGPTLPVLAFVARDAAERAVAATADDLAERGAKVRATSARVAKARRLSFVETAHPLTDALALIVPFYGFVEAWARARGMDPDSPPVVSKVTETR